SMAAQTLRWRADHQHRSCARWVRRAHTVFVQAKRYKRGTKISANVVRQLRQAIPFGGQGAFITTADFQSAASEVALENGFPRIGLINGRQLVDLLIEHWSEIPLEFQDRLALKPGLVRA
ncbi:restriction endonuclease, partial [Hydrogenophaga defluvii]